MTQRTQLEQSFNRLQALRYLVHELVYNKKSTSIEDKIAIKHLLKKATSVEEMQIIQRSYNTAKPVKDMLENVDDLVELYKTTSKSFKE